MKLPALSRGPTFLSEGLQPASMDSRRSGTQLDWLSAAQLTLQLTEEERKRGACLAKLRYLQSRLHAFEQHKLWASTPDFQAAAAVDPVGMKLTPSTHHLAQLERDREIQRRRQRRGRQSQPPPEMTAGPLRGRALAAAAAAAAAGVDAASTTSMSSEGQPPPPPPMSTPMPTTTLQRMPPPQSPTIPHHVNPPPLSEAVTRSAGHYKLGFSSSGGGGGGAPLLMLLEGRIDGQRASIQRQQLQPHSRQPQLQGAAGGGGAYSYLDSQARRLLKISGPPSSTSTSRPSAAAVAALRGDYERTFLHPRNPVNSPEPPGPAGNASDDQPGSPAHARHRHSYYRY